VASGEKGKKALFWAIKTCWENMEIVAIEIFSAACFQWFSGISVCEVYRLKSRAQGKLFVFALLSLWRKYTPLPFAY